MNLLVTIIVPVYNSEKYLKQCIDSIINQTYLDIEVLLIDDGSSDMSGEICDYYSQIDKRIKTIHKNNGGVSAARNVGIKNSTGNYIAFIDSDDYVDKCYIFNLVNASLKYDADIVICNYAKDKSISHYSNYGYIDDLNFASSICNNNEYGGYLWNKFYNSDLIKNNSILFDEDVSIMEDIIFNMKVLEFSKKIYVLDDCLYYYRTNQLSILNSSYNKQNINQLVSIPRIISLLNKYRLVKEIMYFKLFYVHDFLLAKYEFNIRNLDDSIFCVYLNDIKKDFKIAKSFDIYNKTKYLVKFPKTYFLAKKICHYFGLHR